MGLGDVAAILTILIFYGIPIAATVYLFKLVRRIAEAQEGILFLLRSLDQKLERHDHD